MLKLTSSLLCGLMLFATTGCQTAHSVKETIVSWKPSFHKNKQVEAVEEIVDADSENAVAESDDSLQVKTASLLKETDQQATADLEKTVAEEDESNVPNLEDELISFEEYQKMFESKKTEAGQLTAEVEQALEQTEAEAKMLIEDQVAETGDGRSLVDKAFIDTEVLSNEIDALLSEDALEDNPFAEEVVNDNETAQSEEQLATSENPFAESTEVPVQQAVLANNRDAGDIAFDLASFADASLTDLQDFEAFENQTAHREPQSQELDSSEAFPWAINPETHELTTKAVSTEQDLLPESVPVVKVEPRKVKISEEILHNLERALGNENWRAAAGRTNVNSATNNLQPQSKEIQQITELIHSENPQIRMRGLRLAHDKGNAAPEVVVLVESLLEDEDQVVRAHAASVLNLWKLSPEKVISTLASVLASKNKNAQQFAAMYLGDMVAQKKQIVPVFKTTLLSAKGMPALHIAEALLKLEPASVDAVTRLTELLRDENVEVRWLSAHSLGAVQGNLQPYAVEALRGGLRDVDSQVRATSALALGGLGSASQVAVAELNFMLEHGEANVKDAASIALDCIRQ